MPSVVRKAFRRLWQTPGFTALTVATLACAMWPATAIMPGALIAIASGTVLTLVRRTLRLAAHLKGDVA